MGQQLSKSVQFPKTKWYEFKKEGNTCIYHNGNGIYAQKKQFIQVKKLQAQSELKIYKERSETEMPIIKVYNAQLQDEQKNFCSTLQKIQVWVEYIPNRLTAIKSFSLEEAECLYVLQQSLKAFHQLFKKFGYFEINSKMIGFNAEGKVKCWINKNFENNRIQNENSSILGIGDGSSLKIINAMDSKLRESIEKGMTCDLWQIIKKKSNIESKDLFYRLSGLQNCNFQNAQRLIQLLISKTQTKIPDCLYFQNCIQMKKNKYREFNYHDVFNSQSSTINFVQVTENEVIKTANFNFSSQDSDPSFRDFDLYREHIFNLGRSVYENNCGVSISFKNNDHKKDAYKTQFSQKPDQSRLTKNTKDLTDKTFDASQSTILFGPSQKTIDFSNQSSQKKIESEGNLTHHHQNVHNQYPALLAKLALERCILNEVPSNLPSSRVTSQHQKANNGIQTTSIVFIEEPESMVIENCPIVLNRTNSRFTPPPTPPPFSGIIKRQSQAVFARQPQTPHFTKVNHF